MFGHIYEIQFFDIFVFGVIWCAQIIAVYIKITACGDNLLCREFDYGSNLFFDFGTEYSAKLCCSTNVSQNSQYLVSETRLLKEDVQTTPWKWIVTEHDQNPIPPLLTYINCTEKNLKCVTCYNGLFLLWPFSLKNFLSDYVISHLSQLNNLLRQYLYMGFTLYFPVVSFHTKIGAVL